MSYSFSFDALGTHWKVEFEEMSEIDASAIENEVKKIAQEFDDNYSRFKPDSHISLLNKHKKLSSFPKELFSLLKRAQEYFHHTDGHFDIRVGKDLEQKGYDSNYSFTSRQNNKSDYSGNLFEKLTEDTIHISKKHKIDLGGFGKGWLIDKLAEFLLKNKIQSFHIDGGGDILIKGEQEREIGLESPFDLKMKIGVAKLKSGAITCSSPTRRSWIDKRTKERHHHLISPMGHNFEGLAAAFVYGKSASLADMASTTIYVAPPAIAEKVHRNLDLELLLVFTNGSYMKTKNFPGEIFT